MGGTPFGFTTGGGVFDASPAPGVADGDATAQWLQITITSPDREPVVVRRTIFDRVDAEARATGNPDLGAISPATLTDLGPGLQGEYVPAQAEHWLTVSSGRLAGDGFRSALLPAEDPRAFVDLVHAYHLVREAADLELALPGSVRTFHDAPNIVAITVSPSLDPSGAPRAEFGIDILYRSYGTVPVAGQSVAAAPGLLAGVLSHVAERILLGDALPATGPQPDHRPVSVGAVFEAARQGGVALRVLRGVVVPADLAYPREALATLRVSLADGWIVIAPQQPVSIAGEQRIGWWLVNAATGRTVDQMDDGRGAAVDQYAVTLTPTQVAAASVARAGLWKCVVGAVFVSASVLAAGLGGEAGGGLGAVGGVVGAGGTGLGVWLITSCVG